MTVNIANWLCRRCSPTWLIPYAAKSIITVEYLIMEYRKPPSFKFTWYPSISRNGFLLPMSDLVTGCEKSSGWFKFGSLVAWSDQSIKKRVVVSKVANHVSVYMHTQNGIGQMFTSSIQLNPSLEIVSLDSTHLPIKSKLQPNAYLLNWRNQKLIELVIG